MNTLLYLSYGQGPHIQEVIFSILSAYYHDGTTPDYRILIYTDMAEPYRGMDAIVETLTPQQLGEWAGVAEFGFRRKIVAIRQALGKYKSPTLFLDGDTYFKRPPCLLFDRLAPGKSLMHVEEGPIGSLIALGPLQKQIPGQSYTLADGSRYALTAQTPMWNSGVVGVHPADAKVLDEVLELTDTMQARNPDRLSEQTAFGSVLSRRTHLRPCRDFVFHYHQAFIRAPFRKQLPTLLAEWKGHPLEQRAREAYRHRPIPSFSKMAKAALKRLGKPLGLFCHDLETSV